MATCLIQEDDAAANSVEAAGEKALKAKFQNLNLLPNDDEWPKSRK